MRCSIIAFTIWLAITSSAFARSDESLVTSTNLDAYSYVFSVLTNATKDGVAFQVTITSKQCDIYSDSSVGIDMVIHTKLAAGGREGSVGPVTPTIPVALKKESRFWTANFTVSRRLLENPDVFFVFSVLAHSTVNGKIIPMPSVTFYELRLQDFVKLPDQSPEPVPPSRFSLNFTSYFP